MSKIIKIIFLLSATYLTVIASGCRNLNFQTRPEDKTVKLDKREPSPLAKKDENFKSGDPVVIVDNDGNLSFDTVYQIYRDLALVRSKSGNTEWVLSENGRPFDENVERISPKVYSFEYGSRRKDYKYFPSEQIFSVPWANNKNLKVGDVVYSLENKYRYLEKGIVTVAPVGLPNAFYVRFGDNTDPTMVTASEVCSSIEPAKPEDLSFGTFAYYKESRWAMVVGKRDDKIIIREVGYSSDYIVDISKLKILK